jgi:hypothetical protein
VIISGRVRFVENYSGLCIEYGGKLMVPIGCSFFCSGCTHRRFAEFYSCSRILIELVTRAKPNAQDYSKTDYGLTTKPVLTKEM